MLIASRVRPWTALDRHYPPVEFEPRPLPGSDRPLEVALLARRLWGASIAEERDRRLGPSEATPRVRQAERGHVTRALLAELRAALEDGQHR